MFELQALTDFLQQYPVVSGLLKDGVKFVVGH
jgi:hypothetical protein